MRCWSPIVLALLFLHGCPAGETEGAVCPPGDTQTCYCTDGTEGLQDCHLDGSGWDCCQCDDSCGTADDDDSSDPLGVHP